MNCTACGHPLDEGTKFCTLCGAKQEPVAEAPVEEVPVEETPVVETPVEEISVEETPVEEIPAQQEPVEEAPAVQVPLCETCGQPLEPDQKFCIYCGTAIPAAAAAAGINEPKPKKKKKKKKGCLVVLLIVLALLLLIVGSITGVGVWHMTKLDNYNTAIEMFHNNQPDEAMAMFQKNPTFKDTEIFIQQLSAMQEQYDRAHTLLNEKNFEAALTDFRNLGNYRDSEECVKFKVPYHQNLYAMEQANSISAYTAAASGFESLGEYMDSAEKASACYLEAAKLALAEKDVETALGFAEKLNDADTAIFDSLFGDETVLTDLAAALRAAYEYLESNPDDLLGALEAEMAVMEKYLTTSIRNEELAALIDKYLEATTNQKDNFMTVMDNVMINQFTIHLQTQLERREALIALSEQHGLLADDPQVLDAFLVDQEEVDALQDIQDTLAEWYNDVQLENLDGNDYQLVFEKEEGVAFHWTMHIILLNGEEPVAVVVKEVDVEAGETTVYIPVTIDPELNVNLFEGHWTLTLIEEE